MTTNEIMNNLNTMSRLCRDVVSQMEKIMNDTIDTDRVMYVNALARRNSFNFIGTWLDDLQEKHWNEEDEWVESLTLLHLNDRKE